MIFKSLKDKCEYYRSLTDYRLTPNGYVLVMIDGKNFSKLIKNKFNKPFDLWFTMTMNDTAKHLCKNIQNCVGAFVQSDEISLLIKDDTDTCPPFDLRMCKLLSIIPAMATSFFTKKIVKLFARKTTYDPIAFDDMIDNLADYMFDCKVWNVPTSNDAMAWFLYRQIDCVRNSKQQFCQTYLSHNKLKGLNTDKQVKLCKEETGHDWENSCEGNKYGRFIFKKTETHINENGEEYERRVWDILTGDITIPEFREYLKWNIWGLKD